MATCRFCKGYERAAEMVKYGARHYAHFACYLDAGKPLTALSDWQIGRFPFLLLRDRGFEAVAMAAYHREQDRIAALPKIGAQP